MTIAEFEAHGLQTLDSIAGLIARAPADQLDWRPTPTSMSLGQCLAHVANSLSDTIDWVVSPPPMLMADSEAAMTLVNLPSSTPAEALAVLEEQKAKLTAHMASFRDEEWLTKQCDLPWGVKGSQAFCCLQAFEHAFSHRYQLFMYLKLLGQPVDTTVLYGMG